MCFHWHQRPCTFVVYRTISDSNIYFCIVECSHTCYYYYGTSSTRTSLTTNNIIIFSKVLTSTRMSYLVLYNFVLPLSLFVVRYSYAISILAISYTGTGICTVLYWFWLWANLPHLKGTIQYGQQQIIHIQLTSFFILKTQRPIATPHYSTKLIQLTATAYSYRL